MFNSSQPFAGSPLRLASTSEFRNIFHLQNICVWCNETLFRIDYTYKVKCYKGYWMVNCKGCERQSSSGSVLEWARKGSGKPQCMSGRIRGQGADNWASCWEQNSQAAFLLHIFLHVSLCFDGLGFEIWRGRDFLTYLDRLRGPPSLF